jgi:hypothetical protein
MHDWILKDLTIDWKNASLRIQVLCSKSEIVNISAEKFCQISIPKQENWGPSVFINQVIGPVPWGTNQYKLVIEMQSGDCIEVIANVIKLPS